MLSCWQPLLLLCSSAWKVEHNDTECLIHYSSGFQSMRLFVGGGNTGNRRAAGLVPSLTSSRLVTTCPLWPSGCFRGAGGLCSRDVTVTLIPMPTKAAGTTHPITTCCTMASSPAHSSPPLHLKKFHGSYFSTLLNPQTYEDSLKSSV